MKLDQVHPHHSRRGLGAESIDRPAATMPRKKTVFKHIGIVLIRAVVGALSTGIVHEHQRAGMLGRPIRAQLGRDIRFRYRAARIKPRDHFPIASLVLKRPIVPRHDIVIGIRIDGRGVNDRDAEIGDRLIHPGIDFLGRALRPRGDGIGKVTHGRVPTKQG